MLSPGYGELKERLVRLGHMGPAVALAQPRGRPLGARPRARRPRAWPVRVGDGVEAALEVLAQPLEAGART